MRNFLIPALVAATAMTAPAAVQAQRAPATVAVIINTERVYRECTACQSAQTQLQSQITALQTRQRTLSEQIRAEGQPLQQEVQALNGKDPNAQLRQRLTAFQTKQQQAEQELQLGQQRIQSTQANVLRQINERLDPIITQVMTARGANLALSADSTLAHAPALDVTIDVLARLNQALPSVSVTPLSQQQQQQPQPQGR